MKTFIIVLFFPICLWAEQLLGKVVDVHDGDTITVLVDKVQHKVRLYGIDAPEEKQAYGEVSRQALAKLVAGKMVGVEWAKRDRYKRIIGRVSVGEIDVNLDQLNAGMAWHFKEYSKDENYAAAEASAKGKTLGLWADPKALPPWEFRKQKKK